MQLIFYPDSDNQVAQAEYGVVIRHENSIARADVVVINSHGAGLGASLWNSQAGRDLVLNRILANELKGIRVQFIRFFVLVDLEAPGWMRGIELPIRLDINDYMRKGNPHEIQRVAAPGLLGWLRHLAHFGKKRISFWGGHVQGGCADFYTDFEQRRHLPPEEITALCAAVAYQRSEDEHRASNEPSFPTNSAVAATPLAGNTTMH
jgi:hypothetical protein